MEPASTSGRPAAHLTPQELSVAQLVGTGITIREIARELMLSVKTID